MASGPGTDPTLPAADAATTPTASSGPVDAPSRASLSGYRLGELIGRGGMGEVVLAHDEQIGRDVAVKRMRGAPDDTAMVRFLREARIQARLEHPGIVPVYAIGRDEAGQPYFAMKRLAGTTLAALLRSEPPPPRQRLVRAFAEICRAIEFAHSRGVIHRDLKPANIVVGELGEIYVIDWGLARIAGEDEDSAIGHDVVSRDGETQADEILGTPGYMAPEQLRDARTVGPACDVYALGSILFELLARSPLHPPGMEALASTLDGVDGSPARRAPDLDIPPELDAACVAALSSVPASRPSARELAERVQRYLDGDRDLERRRALAADHLATARAALRTGDVAQRSEAARAAGRALALDPESADAAAIVNQLLFEVPRELPADLERTLAATQLAAHKRQARVALLSYASIMAFMVAASWNGVRNWVLFVGITTLSGALGIASIRLSRRPPRVRELMLMVVAGSVLAALASRAFGSLIVVPVVTCIMALSFTSYPLLIDRGRTVIALLVASWIVPVALEAAGVLDPTWSVEGGQIRSSSTMLVIGGSNTVALLVATHVVTLLITGLFASALAVSRRNALRATEIREWHLRQLVSDSATAPPSK